MTEANTKPFPRLYATIVIFLIFLALLTLTLAVCLSVFMDTTLLVRTEGGSTIEQSTYTGEAIGKLWQGFFSSLSALIGLLGGKVL